MAEGRSAFLWSHTSHVLALIANVNRDPKKQRAFRPADFNPHASNRGQPIIKVKMKDVKDLLMGMGKPTVTFEKR
jgi:hypothetical protein